MSLIYLLTSLPDVALGKAPPMSLETFGAEARQFVVGHDREDLEQVLLVGEVDKTILARNRRMLGLPIDDQDTSFEDFQRRRQRNAERIGSVLPPWVLKDRPIHLLMRYWFQKAYARAHCHFLKRYTMLWLNHEEMTAGLLCKLEDMDRQTFLKHMEGGIDSTWKVMQAHYDAPDLGISGRLRRYPEVRANLQLADLQEMEEKQDKLQWRLIERSENTETFSIDQLLAYFFKLRLVHRVAARDADKGRAILEDILQYSPETTS